MADRDETEDAMDSLSWPDTTRPIVSNSMPEARPPATWPQQAPDPSEEARSRGWWPLVAAIVLVLLAAAIVVWLVI